MEKLKSCQPQEPFTKLEEYGKASILNYNLPQSTCYDATSYLGLDIDPKLFKANQKSLPKNNYWDFVGKLPKDELLKKLDLNMPASPGSPIIQNFEIQKRSVITSKSFSDEKEGTPISGFATNNFLADRIKEGMMPVYKQRLSRLPEVHFLPKPLKVNPQISIVLHLKMCSFLGDYGAGRTVKTFSLLPGEKTSISIRSYQYREAVKNLAQNVLDSYSESSAEDLQSSIENEVEHATSLSTSQTISRTGSWKAGGSAGLNLGFFKIGGGGSSSGSRRTRTSINQAIQTQVGILANSTSRHTSKANSLREIEVNTSTTSTAVSESEDSIIRELENVNKSRVLNFVFRQLLQEFISLTYVHDVSFVYSTGFPFHRKSCKLSGLEEMLGEILVNEKAVRTVLNEIYIQLCSIVDREGTKQSLIEKVKQKLTNCINPKAGDQDLEYVRVKQGLKQTYKDKSVNGIIIDATHRVLRTPSLIVDALLGQGEALDCYNSKLQEATTVKENLENEKLKQSIDVITQIEDPVEKANMYQKVFGGCFKESQSWSTNDVRID